MMSTMKVPTLIAVSVCVSMLLATVSADGEDDIGECPDPGAGAKPMCCIRACDSYARPTWDKVCNINRRSGGSCPGWYPFRCVQPVQCCGVRCMPHASCDPQDGKCKCDSGYHLVGLGDMEEILDEGDSPHPAYQNGICRKDTPACEGDEDCGYNQYCTNGECKCTYGYSVKYGNCVIRNGALGIVCNSPFNEFVGSKCDCEDGYIPAGGAGNFCCPKDVAETGGGICKCPANAECKGPAGKCKTVDGVQQFSALLNEDDGCLDCKCVTSTTTTKTTVTTTTNTLITTTKTETDTTYTGSTQTSTFTSATTKTTTVTLTTVTTVTVTSSTTTETSTTSTITTTTTATSTTKTNTVTSVTITTTTTVTTETTTIPANPVISPEASQYRVSILGPSEELPKGVQDAVAQKVVSLLVANSILAERQIMQATMEPLVTSRRRQDSEGYIVVITLERDVPQDIIQRGLNEFKSNVLDKPTPTSISLDGRKWILDTVELGQINPSLLTTVSVALPVQEKKADEEMSLGVVVGIILGSFFILALLCAAGYFIYVKYDDEGYGHSQPVYNQAYSYKGDSSGGGGEKPTGYFGGSTSTDESQEMTSIPKPVVPAPAAPKVPRAPPPQPPVRAPAPAQQMVVNDADSSSGPSNWNVGVMSRKDAEALILSRPNPVAGKFVIRESAGKPDPVLTILLLPESKKFEHHILKRDANGDFMPNGRELNAGCPTLEGLVAYLKSNADGITVALKE